MILFEGQRERKKIPWLLSAEIAVASAAADADLL